MATNDLFQRLNSISSGQLGPSTVRRHFASGQKVDLAKDGLSTVVFPLSGLLSSVVHLDSGEPIETEMVGTRGAFGTAATLGGVNETDIIGQVAGELLAVQAAHLVLLVQRNKEAQNLLSCNERFNLLQAQSRAACNAKHRIEQRLASWLLMASDAMANPEFFIVQEAIAEALGVQRASLSMSASTLSNVMAIEYHRGHINILDRGLLADHACECHARVACGYLKLLGGAGTLIVREAR